MNHASSYRLGGVGSLVVLIMALAACVRPAPVDGVPLTPTGAPNATVPVLIPVVTPTATAVIEALPTDTPVSPPETEVTAAPPDQGGDAGPSVHVVAPGETVYSISLRYGVSMETIMAANNLANPDSLTVGQQLNIPAPGSAVPEPTPGSGGSEQVHVVSAGQNLFRIGLQYGCTADQLSAYNNIPAPYTIYVGDQIRIPPNC